MRIHKQLFISIPLAALLFTGFAAGGIAQDTTTNLNEANVPVILSTTPTDGELNVDLSVIEITFNSDMDENTINESTLLLHATYEDKMHDEDIMHDERSKMMLDDLTDKRSAMKDSDKKRHHKTDAVKGTISYFDKVAVFAPDEELKEGTQYTFTVTDGVKSSEKIALDNDHKWSFTTKRESDLTYSDKQYDKDDMDRDEFNENRMHKNNMYERAMHDSNMQDSTMHERTMDATQIGKDNMIDLGKAGQFVILAKTNINNESESLISGLTGEGSLAEKTKKEQDFIDSTKQRTSGQVIVWRSDKSDTTSLDVSEAIDDMMSAYNNASNHNGDDVTSHMNESFRDTVLTSGIHEWSDALNIESDVTLSGSEDDVWIFKVGDNLTVYENTVFTLTSGAQADNVFWYVEGEVTIGKSAQFEGIILSKNDITLEKGAKLNGRMFSQSSITLDENTVTEPGTMSGHTTSTNR